MSRRAPRHATVAVAAAALATGSIAGVQSDATAGAIRALRPDRVYQVLLVPPAGALRVLASRRPGTRQTVVAAEQQFQISADGQWLGYRGSKRDLHLRSAGGTERVIADVDPSGLFAFAPDGRSVAVWGSGAWPGDELSLVDLHTGARQSLGRFARVAALRWSGRGLIVFHRLARFFHYEPFELFEWDWWSLSALGRLPFSSVTSDNPYAPFAADQVWDDVLSLLPADAGHERGPELLYRGALYSFAAAARGARVIVFARNGAIVDLDASDPERPPRAIDGNRGVVDNAEMSADGTRVLFVGTRTLDWEPEAYLIDPGRAARPLARPCGGDLWFSGGEPSFVCADDGGVLYGPETGAPRAAPPFGGSEAKARAPAVESVRLQPDGRAIVAAGREVFITDLERGTREPLGHIDDRQRRIIAADHFDGGLVLWVEAPVGATRPSWR
jgi:hypothetical protein